MLEDSSYSREYLNKQLAFAPEWLPADYVDALAAGDHVVDHIELAPPEPYLTDGNDLENLHEEFVATFPRFAPDYFPIATDNGDYVLLHRRADGGIVCGEADVFQEEWFYGPYPSFSEWVQARTGPDSEDGYTSSPLEASVPEKTYTQRHQGAVKELDIRGETFEGLDIHALNVGDSAFHGITVRDSRAYYLRLERCRLSEIAWEDCEVSHVSLLDSTLEYIGQPIETGWIETIDGCTLEGVTLTGSAAPGTMKLVNTTVRGALFNLSVSADYRFTQLADCDFSEATLHKVSFPGVDARRVTWPEDKQQFVLEDWPAIAGKLYDAARQLISASDKESPEYLAAVKVHSAIAADNSSHAQEHGCSSINGECCPERGARYASELDPAGQDPTLMETINQLYAPYL
ncbi:hypothetical protein CGLAUT_09290 [Corynebacterium glaucum]|uniref:pentapeptide repeat-containing protein n=1 Tax=Corynebacterium glaucum TaxID=187491 RepID=UPI0025B56FC2|nr:hypothetical protein [Corynebacterium glaucum]WJZ08333.1 hypothetical protein CGLAUT_09290 [Corynebacterium glaucum]